VVGFTVQADATSGRCGGITEQLSRRIVTEHDETLAAKWIPAAREGPSVGRCRAKHIEEIERDKRPGKKDGLSSRRGAHHVLAMPGKGGKRPILTPEIEKISG
jgi:hypothetical protein